MIPRPAVSRKNPTARARSDRETHPPRPHASSRAFSAHHPLDDAAVRVLASNELLFSLGDPKTHFYAVQSGVLAVYEPRWNGHRAIIEFAFPGDLVSGDYLTYCGSYDENSAKGAQCMRAVGARLSQGCINALVASGEVSKSEVTRRSTAKR